LQQNLSRKGFTVLGFPCNQFGNQEPGSNSEIKQFVAKFHVTFPMFSKIDVNGPNALPLFTFLKNGVDIRWNFEKFLIDRNGKLYRRYLTNVEPFSFRQDILHLLSLRREENKEFEQVIEEHEHEDEIL